MLGRRGRHSLVIVTRVPGYLADAAIIIVLFGRISSYDVSSIKIFRRQSSLAALRSWLRIVFQLFKIGTRQLTLICADVERFRVRFLNCSGVKRVKSAEGLWLGIGIF
ncbi:hypothetical protein DZK27_10345 [Rhodobacteraceae bacterium 63075]|nr:hypothetical protein DZK27_10345 [Rhodobacteraceae bacterium 63075]